MTDIWRAIIPFVTLQATGLILVMGLPSACAVAAWVNIQIVLRGHLLNSG